MTGKAKTKTTFILVFVQPGGWEIAREFDTVVSLDALTWDHIKGMAAYADRIYRRYPDGKADVFRESKTEKIAYKEAAICA